VHRLVLGNYLAERGIAARSKLKACLIISVPWNVLAATKNMEKNYFNLMINRHLATSLRRTIEQYHSDVGPFNDIDKILKVYVYHIESLKNRIISNIVECYQHQKYI
jgi:predicted alpha/beta-fold hydrolase